MNIMKNKRVKKAVRFIAVFMIFFIGTCSVVAIDTICKETTDRGGKLVFDVEKALDFN